MYLEELVRSGIHSTSVIARGDLLVSAIEIGGRPVEQGFRYIEVRYSKGRLYVWLGTHNVKHSDARHPLEARQGLCVVSVIMQSIF